MSDNMNMIAAVHENLSEKTAKLLSYLVQRHPKPSVTVLMKLCYFVDLVHIKKYNVAITDFSYIRYNYGPFDKKIYSYLEKMHNDQTVREEQGFANESSNDFIVLSPDEKATSNVDFLTTQELESVDSVLSEVGGYGAKALTDIAYKTAPMKKLGATRGGVEGMYQQLDMHA